MSFTGNWNLVIRKILSRVRDSVTNNNGFLIRWLNLLTPSLQSLLITISYDSSQSMAAYDSLHSLLDYECLFFWSFFYCDWPGSDLRTTHFTDELRMTNAKWITYELITCKWIRSSLHGCLYSLAVTMENVCCLSVDTETRLVLNWSAGIHLHRNVC
jgi:hypothetical protein